MRQEAADLIAVGVFCRMIQQRSPGTASLLMLSAFGGRDGCTKSRSACFAAL